MLSGPAPAICVCRRSFRSLSRLAPSRSPERSRIDFSTTCPSRSSRPNLAAFLMGRVDLRGLGELPPMAVPVPLRYGLGFNPGACLPFAFLYVITVIESIGDLTATSLLTNQPIQGETYFRRLRSGIL